jgi:hypothetical protein
MTDTEKAAAWDALQARTCAMPSRCSERPRDRRRSSVPGPAARIDLERNAEVRRAMIERYGREKYLREGGGEKVQTDAFGTLWRKPQSGADPIVCVEVLNSTPEPDGSVKTYFLPCHHELRPLLLGQRFGEPQEMTARNAVASLFGLRGEQYAPAKRRSRHGNSRRHVRDPEEAMSAFVARQAADEYKEASARREHLGSYGIRLRVANEGEKAFAIAWTARFNAFLDKHGLKDADEGAQELAR